VSKSKGGEIPKAFWGEVTFLKKDLIKIMKASLQRKIIPSKIIRGRTPGGKSRAKGEGPKIIGRVKKSPEKPE